MEKLKKYKTPLVLALCLLLIVSAVMGKSPSKEKRLYGQPRVSTDYADTEFRSVRQMVDDGHRLYIMASGQDGVVHVYDLKGNYQSTLLFYCHQNGGFTLAVEEDTLYVQDMQRNVYLFRGGEFLEFLPEEVAETKFSHIDFRWDSSTEGYDFRAGSIWRATAEGEECVIEGPSPVYFYIRKSIFPVILIGVLFFKTYEERKKYKEQDGRLLPSCS